MSHYPEYKRAVKSSPSNTVAVFILLWGMSQEDCVVPISGQPCLTGLYVIENSPRYWPTISGCTREREREREKNASSESVWIWGSELDIQGHPTLCIKHCTYMYIIHSAFCVCTVIIALHTNALCKLILQCFQWLAQSATLVHTCTHSYVTIYF